MALLDSSGYTRATVAEIKVEIRDLLKVSFGSGIAVGDGVLSNYESFVSIMTDVTDRREQEMERLYSSRYVSTAIGESLEQAVRFSGISRLLESKTISDPATPNVITGTPATIIPINSRVEIVASGERFKTLSEVTIGGGGTINVNVEAINTGPVVFVQGDSVSGGEVTIIDTVAGWDDFTFGAVVLGRNDETDEALRIRHAQSLQSTSGSTADALLAKILTVQGINSVLVIENDTDLTDSGGRPPHSFEVVVDGGADQDIINAIGDSKPLGIATFGDTSGTFTDTQGTTYTIKFSRVVNTDIFMNVTIDTDGLYPADGDEQVKTAVALFGSENYKQGSLLIWDAFFEAVFTVPGITNVLVEGSKTFGLENDTNLLMGIKEKPIFTTPNIQVL